LFLPNWFVRSRGLAIGLAFSGVGLGSVTLLPWVQSLIIGAGWRDACRALGLLILIVLAPINLLLRKRPEDMGLLPDGDAAPLSSAPLGFRTLSIRTGLRSTGPYAGPCVPRDSGGWHWDISGALYAWYAVQVHQTKYLQEVGFSANRSAWALGLVSLIGVAGQISLGHVSDRIGREWIWAVSMLGFVICFLALIVLRHDQSLFWLYLMVAAQGGLGYGLTSVMGATVAEIFQGRQFGGIFGTVMLAAMAGGAAGPWVTGVLHDAFGDYTLAFWVGACVSVVSAFAIWRRHQGKFARWRGRFGQLEGAGHRRVVIGVSHDLRQDVHEPRHLGPFRQSDPLRERHLGYRPLAASRGVAPDQAPRQPWRKRSDSHI
jgi:hypothetical protein